MAFAKVWDVVIAKVVKVEKVFTEGAAMAQAIMKRPQLLGEAVGPEVTQPIQAHPQVSTPAELVGVMPKAQMQTKMRAPVAVVAAVTFMVVVAAAADRILIFWVVTAGHQMLLWVVVGVVATTMLAVRAGSQAAGRAGPLGRTATRAAEAQAGRVQNGGLAAAVAAATTAWPISRISTSAQEAVRAAV